MPVSNALRSKSMSSHGLKRSFYRSLLNSGIFMKMIRKAHTKLFYDVACTSAVDSLVVHQLNCLGGHLEPAAGSSKLQSYARRVELPLGAKSACVSRSCKFMLLPALLAFPALALAVAPAISPAPQMRR